MMQAPPVLLNSSMSADEPFIPFASEFFTLEQMQKYYALPAGARGKVGTNQDQGNLSDSDESDDQDDHWSRVFSAASSSCIDDDRPQTKSDTVTDKINQLGWVNRLKAQGGVGRKSLADARRSSISSVKQVSPLPLRTALSAVVGKDTPAGGASAAHPKRISLVERKRSIPVCTPSSHGDGSAQSQHTMPSVRTPRGSLPVQISNDIPQEKTQRAASVLSQGVAPMTSKGTGLHRNLRS